MLRRVSAAGFTLIELLVTLTVLAFLMLAAAPEFATMIGNARVRQAAESLQNALRHAQAAAVQRNRQVVLMLTNDRPGMAARPAANGSNFVIRALPLLADSKSVDDATLYVYGGSLTPTAGGTSITGAAQTCFNSTGRVVGNVNAYSGSTAGSTLTVNCGVASWVTTFNITSPSAERRLDVQLFFGGRVRMCTPDATYVRLLDGCV